MMRRRWYLSDRTLLLLCIVMCTAVIGILSTAWLAAFAASLILLSLAVVSDWFSLPKASGFSISIRAPIYVELDSEYTFTINGRVTDGNVPEYLQLNCSEHLLPIRSKDPCAFSAGVVTSSASVKGVRLGFASVKSVTLWIPSRLGMWLLGQDVPVENVEFRVLPKRKVMPPDRFRETIVRQLAALQGDRRLVKMASPDLYHSSRPYRYPDPLRFMDRRKTAKYGEMYTKCFDSMQEHHLVLVLDLGRALCGSVGDSAKHDYYLSGALGLAEHAIKSRDSVSIVAFSDRLHLLKHRCRSRDSLSELYRGDPSIQPREVASDYELMLKIIQRTAAQRSIVVVLTDTALSSVQAQLLLAFKQLSMKHLCVALSMLENRYDLTMQVAQLRSDNLTETEHLSLLYSYAISDQLRLFGRKLGHFGATSVNVPQDYWLSATVKVFESLRHSLNM